jgi:SPP1 gp7 family putative phage head morphogenesis protein
MQRLLRDADGVFKTFGEFKKEAKQIYDTFNVLYLRTEFNTAFASSQAAENWADLQNRKDVFPNVRYRTVGDDNVRPEHQALNGNVYALDSSDLSVVYPPNDWNCRCYVESTTSPVKNSVTNNLAQLNPDFAFNAGKDRILFPPKHPYYNVPKSFAAKKKRNFDLPIDI